MTDADNRKKLAVMTVHQFKPYRRCIVGAIRFAKTPELKAQFERWAVLCEEEATKNKWSFF
jgi:hypothetical protein